jgi:tRNA pseudouridine55 synthase
VRALARDLGALSGSAAHLTALRRLRSGSFHIADAATVDALRAGTAAVLPPLRALGGTPAQSLDEAEIGRVVRGLDVEARVSGERAALVSNATGALVALAERRGGRWQPRVVMRRA